MDQDAAVKPTRGRRVLLVNVLAGVGSQGVTALAGLWSVPQILAGIGTVGYGAYSVAAALVGYFSIAELGLSNATVQRLARVRGAGKVDEFGTVVGTSAAVLGGVGLFIALVLATFAVPLGRVLAGATATDADRATVIAVARWCAVGAVPALVRLVPDAVLQASEHLGRSYAVGTVANLIRTVGAVIAVWIWPSAITPVIVLVVATVFQFAALTPLAFWSAPELRASSLGVTASEFRSLTSVGLPLWISGGALLLAGQVDRLIVSSWFGLATVGRYAVAQDLASRLCLLPNVIVKAFYPRLALQLAKDRPEQHETTVRALGIAALGASAIPAVPLAMSSSMLLAAWTGRSDLGEAVAVFNLLAFGVVASGTSTAAYTVFQVTWKFRVLTITCLTLLAIECAGCALLPRWFGSAGAAAASLVANGIASVVLNVTMRRSYTVRVVSDTARVLGAALLTAGFMLLFASTFPPSPVNLHLGLAGRLAPVIGRILAWSVVGTLITSFLVSVGRTGEVKSILQLRLPR